MKLSKIVNKCQLEKIVFCTDCEIENGYCGDLMSDVMAHAEAECIWITGKDSFTVCGEIYCLMEAETAKD